MKKSLILPWRTPLFSVFSQNAKWQSLGDSEIVNTVSDLPDSADSSATETNTSATKEVEKERGLIAGVCDLSPLPRLGGKGEFSDNAPAVNNFMLNNNGVLFCRLGDDEILVLSTNGDEVEIGNYMPQPRLSIPRRDSHCQIGVSGACADKVLARHCAVPPPQHPHLLQTLVADLSAIIVPIPQTKSEILTYYILADSGYALHLWNALCGTAAKLGGGVIGWRQWREINGIGE